MKSINSSISGAAIGIILGLILSAAVFKTIKDYDPVVRVIVPANEWRLNVETQGYEICSFHTMFGCTWQPVEEINEDAEISSIKIINQNELEVSWNRI